MLSLIDQLRVVSKAPTYTISNYEVSPGRLQHLKANHKLQTERAIAKYRAVMYGRGWLTTADIENLLGLESTVANAFLRKLHAKGYIKREPRDGGAYIKNRGWKFMWHESM